MRLALQGVRRLPTTGTSAYTIRGAHPRHTLLSPSYFSTTSASTASPSSPAAPSPAAAPTATDESADASAPSPSPSSSTKGKYKPTEWYHLLKPGHGGLDAFMDHPNDDLEPPPGAAWPMELLRLKSFEDLRALWFVLLKEKNRLASEKLYRSTNGLDPKMGSLSRMKKVRESMGRIRHLLMQRSYAYRRSQVRHYLGEEGELKLAELDSTVQPQSAIVRAHKKGTPRRRGLPRGATRARPPQKKRRMKHKLIGETLRVKRQESIRLRLQEQHLLKEADLPKTSYPFAHLPSSSSSSSSASSSPSRQQDAQPSSDSS